jgi:glycogen operon protein
VFRRRQFLSGEEVGDAGLPDVWWFRTDGLRMTARDWKRGGQVLGMFLNGDAIAPRGPRGEHVVDDSFLLLFNGGAEDRTFTLPHRRFGEQWVLELSTADPDAEPGTAVGGAHGEVHVGARSVLVLRRA